MKNTSCGKRNSIVDKQLKMNEPVDNRFWYGGTCRSGRILSVCTGYINCEKVVGIRLRSRKIRLSAFKSVSRQKKEILPWWSRQNKWRKRSCLSCHFIILLYMDYKSWIFQHTMRVLPSFEMQWFLYVCGSQIYDGQRGDWD